LRRQEIITTVTTGTEEVMSSHHMPFVLAALALWFVADCDVPASAQRMERGNRPARQAAPTKYRIAAADLQRIGIARGAMPAFPNKCYGDVSVSSEFFDQFRAKGFSLEALCLAITSPWVQYNPETGRPLAVTKEFLLEVPACFKNGMPFLDCRFNFDHSGGQPLSPEQQQKTHARAVEVDAAVRRIIASGRYTTPCRCEDMKWSAGYRDVTIAPRAYCKVDVAPACLEQMSRRAIIAGSLVTEVTGFGFEGVPTKGFTDYGEFEISSRLPRGYAYRIGSPEGDDDTPFVDLPPGQRIGIGVQ
jgi:hypothetical protein